MNTHFSDQYHRPYLMGFSIVIIFIFHIWSFALIYDNFNIPIMGNIFECGYFGVDIFFFLSTYGLTCSINKNPIKLFYKNRFSRIIPIYFVYTLLSLPIFFIDWNAGTRYFFYNSSITVPNVEWYTPSLLLIYILFPIINKISKLLARCNFSIISLFIIVSYTVFFNISLPNANLWHRVPIIFLGCIMYYLEKKNDNNAICVLAILALFGTCFVTHSCIDRITLAIPAALYIVGKANTLPFYRFISFLGKWSFEIYLAQVIATKYFMKIYNGNIVLEIIYVVLITIVLGIFFSLISHYYKRITQSKRESLVNSSINN